MTLHILDSVKAKRTGYELVQDKNTVFYVRKIVDKKITYLYHTDNHALAMKFYERTIGA